MSPNMDDSTEKYDVIVVGGGNATLGSALAACEEGAKVLILERVPDSERGGKSTFTEGLIYRIVELPHYQLYPGQMRVLPRCFEQSPWLNCVRSTLQEGSERSPIPITELYWHSNSLAR
jgi:choline dehydrogenase-like flavoprotein